MPGFYTFKWDRPASEVYVTGSFDGWSRSTKLDHADGVFVKKVQLPVENILYKFVVDGDWVIDPSAPTETDSAGIQNSILFAQNIIDKDDMFQAAINSVMPSSTTTELAAAVPKEQEKPANGAAISSAAPESTTAALAGEVPLATPAADAVPGGFPETPATEKTDPQEQTFSVNPIAASDTAENSISLKPGEPIPTDVNAQSVESHVKLDKESYEKGATNYPLDSLVLPDVVTPADQRLAAGRGILDLPKNLIPESSLPITSAAEAKANTEASEVKHVQVPEIVKESQKSADSPPEASAVPEIVDHKAEVESELKTEVSEEPAIAQTPAESGPSQTSVDSVKAVEAEPERSEREATPATAEGVVLNKPVEAVPEPVKESLAAAGSPVEAAGDEAAVAKKETVEEQLKTQAQDEAASAPVTNGVPIANGTSKSTDEARTSIDSTNKKQKRRSFMGHILEKLHFGKRK